MLFSLNITTETLQLMTSKLYLQKILIGTDWEGGLGRSFVLMGAGLHSMPSCLSLMATRKRSSSSDSSLIRSVMALVNASCQHNNGQRQRRHILWTEPASFPRARTSHHAGSQTLWRRSPVFSVRCSPVGCIQVWSALGWQSCVPGDGGLCIQQTEPEDPSAADWQTKTQTHTASYFFTGLTKHLCLMA